MRADFADALDFGKVVRTDAHPSKACDHVAKQYDPDRKVNDTSLSGILRKLEPQVEVLQVGKGRCPVRRSSLAQKAPGAASRRVFTPYFVN